ncbi:MAG TPA: hypothetical protein VMV72_18545 [Verrucomicrobiae bacterium]|nr:hypothetical protein [Verrucomicrobiae bacterium]
MTDHKKCDHMNADGTFQEVDGSRFNSCVLHMMQCEGHDKESATKICGKIAQEKLAGAAEKSPIPLTGLSTPFNDFSGFNGFNVPSVSDPDLWIVYLPKGDRVVDQVGADGSPTKLRVNPSALSAKRMEAARRAATDRPNSNKPYVDYNHDDKEASGRPLRFAWHDELGVIGLTRRTPAALKATTGDPPEFQAFSPHVPIDPETGEAVGIYMNCGGFVNRPLFGDATALSAAAHLPQELVAADPNAVALVDTAPEDEAAVVGRSPTFAGRSPASAGEGRSAHADRPTASHSFATLIGKLCARYSLDPATVAEEALIVALDRDQAEFSTLTARACLTDHAIVALGFEKSCAPTPEELTAKAATLRQPSDDVIGKELAGFAVGAGILAPAERAEWERRLAKDRGGWSKELAAKAPSVLLARVIKEPPVIGAAGGVRPKARWEHRVDELCASDPLIAPVALKDPAHARSIALERIAKEEPALLKEL